MDKMCHSVPTNQLSAVWQEDGHMVARVRPSQALSDLLVDALKKSED